jgi:hypothetical protein
VSTASALGDEHAFLVYGEVVELFARVVIVDDRPYRNRDVEIFAGASMAIASFAMASARRSKSVVEAEFEKRVFLSVGDQIDIAALAPIAAAGTASRNVFLTAKGDAAMAAVARFDCDFGFVDERGFYSTGTIEMNLPVAPLSWN